LETALLIILTLVGLAVCTAMWVRAVMAFFQLKGPRPQAIEVAAVDGWKLCAWHRVPSTRRFLEPVVLCHGLSNNHRFLEFQAPHSLANALAEAGFEVFTVELRGAGAAFAGHQRDGSIDDYVRFDVPALINFATAQAGSPRAFWVGHSLGGLVGLAAADASLQEKLKGLVTIGSPVFFKFQFHTRWLLHFAYWLSPFGRFRTDWLAALVAPFAGWVHVPIGGGMANQRNIPGWVQRRAMAEVIAPIWHGVLRQLRDWTLHDRFVSEDGTVDYRERVRALRVPHLVVGGVADLIAPPSNCNAHFALAGSEDKQLRIFGAAFGQEANYGHGDLLLGTRASVEVYPPLVAWLRERATPVPAD
jgi:pimeloyl-ACP methyl ester carboxylesterase